MLLAIKEDVDREREPGKYVLTGSSNVLTMPRVADSLAGRMEVITLRPLSGEIEGEKKISLISSSAVSPVSGTPTKISETS